MCVPSFAGITISENQMEIVFAPTCNHVPISIPYVPDEISFDETQITVSSDSSWAIPYVNSALDRIEITFSSENMIASYTATISVDDGEKVIELFIHANVSALDIYRLLDDPLRSKTYGIQRNGIYNGSIVAFDPVQESLISCLTVGESPTDFVINDDSTELFVINSVGKTIDVIDLVTFSLKETINLPVYSAWGDADDTTANIDLGPADIIYYIDGSWGPVLHVLKRSTGTILQSIIFDGSSPSNNTGFMDIAITSDKTRMVAMPQYGWSAGSHPSDIGQFTINEDGTVNFVKKTSLSNFKREPFEAPVLMRDDDQIAVMKTIATDPANTDNLDRTFPSALWSINPNGSIVATGDKLYDYNTGIELFTIPGGSVNGSGYIYTKAQAFTSDFTRFVYFNSSDRTLNVVNLIDEIGLEQLGRSQSPTDGSVVLPPDTLTWTPLTGIDQYDLYMGTDYTSVATASHASPSYLGPVNGTSFSLTQTLPAGVDYFWRIDPVTIQGPEIGTVYTFKVSDISIDLSKIDVRTITGHSDFQVDIQLASEEPGVSWTASAADSWITFTENAGATPSTLNVHLDSTMISSGLHTSSITLVSGTDQLHIPVQIEVDPLSVTHIRSDRLSANSYAISEDTSNAISRAYLLEIDTATEEIQRVVPVGSSVTDFAIHYADNFIYVTNWKSGNLLAIDRSTFEHKKSFAFNPAGATGYSEGDVYRVAAGVSERLVVEEEDQWIGISIFNAKTGAVLNEAFVREGGGAFDPTGRYYYHGENNSSGAAIIKLDTSGDTFTTLVDVRPPEMSSYYGSRTVVISEDGSRIFWAGVVLNQDLETEWGIGDIVYSTTADGRYAFCNTAIYDVNFRRQVLAMPTSTNVSGYNSTSNKLIAQVGDDLKFYHFTTPISIPAPVITASNPTYNSIELSWTDDSLEMQFVLQQRLSGTNTWTDIQATGANVTSFTAIGLLEGSDYEFRIRASTSDYSSPWSNIDTATTKIIPPSPPALQQPTATETTVSLMWSDSSGETGYVLERSPNGSDNWTVISLLGANVITYVDSPLSQDTTFFYRVKTIKNQTESGYSSIRSVTTRTSSILQASDYYPLDVGNQWIHALTDGLNETTTVTAEAEYMAGRLTKVIEVDGSNINMFDDSTGIGFVRLRTNDSILTFQNDPLLLLPATFEVGTTVETTGSVILTIPEGSIILPYRATVNVQAVESITVPAGTFTAYLVQSTIDASEYFAGYGTISLGINDKTWLAKGIGDVKSEATIWLSSPEGTEFNAAVASLVSTNLDSDNDSVGIDYDNCPNVANPAQSDIDSDGKGDMCDPYEMGDVNEDDIVDLKDFILVVQVVTGITPSQTIYREADANGDDKIGIEEAVFILEEIANYR